MIQRKSVVFTASAFLFLILFSASSLIASQENSNKQSFSSLISQSENSDTTSVNSNPSNPQSTLPNLQCKKTEVIQKTQKLQMPFIANNGQTDERVKFYANTFGGTVFVTKDGEIFYSLPKSGKTEDRGRRPENRGKKAVASSRASVPLARRLDEAYYSPLKRGVGGVSDHSQNPQSETGSQPRLGIQNMSSSVIEDPKSERKTVSLKEVLVGAKISEIKGEEKAATNVSYFKGKDPSKWKTNISTYEVVNLGEVYDGIELKLKAYGNNVEKLFCVKPGANPDQIKVRLSGVKECRMQNAECGKENPKSEFQNPKFQINKSGELEVETELGPVKFTKPVAYQEINGKRVDVAVEYSIQNPEARGKRQIGSREKGMGRKGAYLTSNFKHPTENLQPKTQNSSPATRHTSHSVYSFTVASYDKTKELIIDPVLASTYLGASGNSDGEDYGKSIVINSDGNIYVAGYTSSSNFPTTIGAYNTSYSNSTDIFISKLSGDLTSLLASTYLGGANSDYGSSMLIDASGNVYVTGYTYSSDFPVTTEAYDTSYNDSGDVFVAKLNGDLTSLLASTFLGGSGYDYANSIIIDSAGDMYVTGYTESSNFPTTDGAYDTQCCNYSSYSWEGGDAEIVFCDAFVSKLNGSLTSLLAATYLGGSDDDYGESILEDTNGNIYIAGYTASSDFPTTQGAYSASSGYHYISCDYTVGCDENYGNYDVFISKLNSELTSLISSTCLGGGVSFWFSERDYNNTIAIDSIGNIYLAGCTNSSSFPTTTEAYDTSYNDSGDVFVAKLNGELTSILASTFLGGSGYDYESSLIIDSTGTVYVSGCTYSSDFPTTTGAYNNSGDVFISRLSGDLTNLISSTYLGGTDSDEGSALALDSSGNVYVAGYTKSSDFPTTTGDYDTSHNGNYDVFVSKLDDNLTKVISSTYLGGTDFYYDDYCSSITINSSGNVYVTGDTESSDFPVETGAYDTVYSGGDDIFISRLSGDLTSLLASTYLGGANSDYGSSISIDASGNVYVTGNTYSSDFPTTTGAYDASYNNSGDVFVAKLDGELTSILASTFLGGSGYDYGSSMLIDASGNVYVAGNTYSSDFPTTTEAYDTSYNDSGDVFISKLSSDLTKLLTSTFLGGSAYDSGSIAIDSSGNIYVAGSTRSADFPVTPGSYDLSFNTDIYNYGYVSDAFVSKLNGDLTDLLASTFLGGSAYDSGGSIAIDSVGNVYVAGDTSSSDFPITPYALYAYYSDSTDTYISKLSANLTNLLSSTYIKSGVDNCIKIDSAGNIYTAGSSSILKLNENLTRLLDSASLDGYINSLALDSDGNVYMAGYTNSTEFQTTTGAYDTFNAGDYDAFITKFDNNLSSTAPTVSTGTVTNIKSTSATLNGLVNANGASTNVSFEYDTTSGSYSNTTSTQFLNGLKGTDTVSIDISGLSPETTYYYRIAAQNSFGTTYGSETSFTTNISSPPAVTTGPATNITYNSANLNGTVNANEFLTTAWFEYKNSSGSYSSTSSTQSVSGSDNSIVSIDISGLSPETTYYYRVAAQNSVGTSYGSEMSFTTLSLSKGNISGYVSDIKGNPIESVKLSLKGKHTKISKTSFSDSDGFFEFEDLEADTYMITATKKGYKKAKRSIKLQEEDKKKIDILMKKNRRKIN